MSVIVVASCPECGAAIELEDPVVREIIECPDCGAELEINGLEGGKAQLVVAELEGDDWGE